MLQACDIWDAFHPGQHGSGRVRAGNGGLGRAPAARAGRAQPALARWVRSHPGDRHCRLHRGARACTRPGPPPPERRTNRALPPQRPLSDALPAPAFRNSHRPSLHRRGGASRRRPIVVAPARSPLRQRPALHNGGIGRSHADPAGGVWGSISRRCQPRRQRPNPAPTPAPDAPPPPATRRTGLPQSLRSNRPNRLHHRRGHQQLRCKRVAERLAHGLRAAPIAQKNVADLTRQRGPRPTPRSTAPSSDRAPVAPPCTAADGAHAPLPATHR